jgi:hypothetical protein
MPAVIKFPSAAAPIPKIKSMIQANLFIDFIYKFLSGVIKYAYQLEALTASDLGWVVLFGVRSAALFN